MSGRLVVRRATYHGALVDVVVDGGRIVEMPPTGRTPAPGGDVVVDADGGAVLPGLHDHHLHLLAMAAARHSVPVGPPAVHDAVAFAAALAAADVTAEPGRWLRAVGYHESVAGELDGARLDALVPTGRPIRVQHRSGACWIVNRAAAEALRLAGAPGAAAGSGVERGPGGGPTGRLFGLDAWLRERVPPEPPDLAGVGAELTSYGVTSVTDATPTELAADLEAIASARLPLRVTVTGGPALATDAAADLRRGPVKLYPADHDLPSIDDLAAQIRRARRLGRAVAVHCVTRTALVIALAAWDDAGGAVAGDRLEHGAVVPVELAGELAARGITVVTQPAFVRARGDAYLADVDPPDRADLWRCASLLAAGVRVAGGSDAPFGPADPWLAIASATDRTTAGGAVLGPAEALDPAGALGLYLGAGDDPGGPPRRLAPGAPGDLCVLDAPLPVVLGDPSARRVVATIAAGQVTYRR